MLNFPTKAKLRRYICIEARAEIALVGALIGFPDGGVRIGHGITENYNRFNLLYPWLFMKLNSLLQA